MRNYISGLLVLALLLFSPWLGLLFFWILLLGFPFLLPIYWFRQLYRKFLA